ncbi:MAG: trypsin-like serine protease [Planctomycetota bacterium]|jgi:hypothetical protein
MRSLGLLFLLSILVALPANAITGGTQDLSSTEHPNVCTVNMRFTTQPGGILMSGTLIHPRVVLTAAHGILFYRQAIAAGMSTGIENVSVNFNPVVPPGPVGLFGHRPVVDMTTFSNEDLKNDTFQGQLHDVGLILLEEPVTHIEPARLPTADLLTDLKFRRDTSLRIVGYGAHHVSLSPPTWATAIPFERRYTDLKIKGISPATINLHVNPHRGNGGALPGDSGGPAFLTHPTSGRRILVGICSASDQRRVGNNFFARVDLPEVLAFIQDNLPQ